MSARTLLYLHGFRSSPQSAKARVTAARVQAINAERAARGQPPLRWLCPQLPPSPEAAIALCQQLAAAVPAGELGLIGSSLGGFYATVLAERLGCRAALLNPAVDPARDLAAHIGTQTAWHDPTLRFDFTAADVAALRALQVGDPRQPVPHPQRYFVVIAQDDEVLDWREMAARYAGATLRIVPHGGHALSDYAERHVDDVLRWLGAL